MRSGRVSSKLTQPPSLLHRRLTRKIIPRHSKMNDRDRINVRCFPWSSLLESSDGRTECARCDRPLRTADDRRRQYRAAAMSADVGRSQSVSPAHDPSPFTRSARCVKREPHDRRTATDGDRVKTEMASASKQQLSYRCRSSCGETIGGSQRTVAAAHGASRSTPVHSPEGITCSLPPGVCGPRSPAARARSPRRTGVRGRSGAVTASWRRGDPQVTAPA